MRISFAAAVLLAALPIGAHAASCNIIIYFSDAAHMRPLGSWSNCPGQKGMQGKRSKFFEKETEEIRSTAIPTRGLPCEFLVRGCKIFEPRPNAPRQG